MMRQFCIRSVIVVLSLIVLDLLGSCVSQPKELPAIYSVNVQKMDESGILAIYSNKDVNPFIEPGSFLRGKVNEFTVFKIDIYNDQQRSIRIDGIMLDREQKYIEAYYSDQLIAYWDQFITKADKSSLSSYAKKRNLISKIVLPSDAINLKPGKYIYYLVFIGPYPMKKPAQAQIDISASTGEFSTFKFAIE